MKYNQKIKKKKKNNSHLKILSADAHDFKNVTPNTTFYYNIHKKKLLFCYYQAID